MKQLKQIITEKLRLDKNTKSYEHFRPQTIDELDVYVKKQKQKAKRNHGGYGTKDNPVDLSFIDFSELLNNTDTALEWYFDTDAEILYMDASEWIIKPNVMVSLDHLFSDTSLKYIDVSNWQFNENIHSLSSLFIDSNYLEEIKGINTWDVQYITRINNMFRSCYNLQEIDLSNWNTQLFDTCRSVFAGCKNIKKIDLTGWKTDEVKSFARCFCNCFKLATIKGIENFNMNKCKNIDNLFADCHNLKINVDKWQFTTEPSMENAFIGVDKKYWAKWYHENN